LGGRRRRRLACLLLTVVAVRAVAVNGRILAAILALALAVVVLLARLL